MIDDQINRGSALRHHYPVQSDLSILTPSKIHSVSQKLSVQRQRAEATLDNLCPLCLFRAISNDTH